jgi:hypothetical protein
MPRLTEEQQQIILRLSYPLPPPQRNEFYRRVAVEIASLPEIGDGALYRLAVGVQRGLIDYPQASGGPGPKYGD